MTTMTVKELKKLLEDKPNDLEVYVWHCGGDSPLESGECEIVTSIWKKDNGKKYLCLSTYEESMV